MGVGNFSCDGPLVKCVFFGPGQVRDKTGNEKSVKERKREEKRGKERKREEKRGKEREREGKRGKEREDRSSTVEPYVRP